MKKTVFISSTYADLIDERRRVWDLLRNYDVLVKGMEEFGARKEDAATTCKLEVEQSDIYVGIIGLRYGSEEPVTNKSYTQYEYELAVEQNKEILIYINDEANYLSSQVNIQFDKIDKLNNFKKLLRQRHTVDTFSNGNDLIEKLKHQFDKYFKTNISHRNEIDYDNTDKILELFFLVPKVYSGREIKLKIKFLDELRPLSKKLCSQFNFEFGSTVGCPIKVTYPEKLSRNIDKICFDYRLVERYLKLDKELEYEIYANINFKEEKIYDFFTNFVDKKRMVDPIHSYSELAMDPDLLYMEDPLKPYVVTTEGDGTIFLWLKEIK